MDSGLNACASPRNDEALGHRYVFSRLNFVRVIQSIPSSRTRAQGTPGVWHTRKSRVQVSAKNAHELNYRYAATVRHSLRNGLRLIRALLGVPGLLATVPPGS